MCNSPWSRGGVWRTLLLGLLAATSAMAQGDPTVTIQVQPEDIGLGVLRLGTWTPMHVSIDHQGTRPRSVIVEWILPDVDRDLVESRRTMTLQPRKTSRAWLYAVPRTSTRKTDLWYVRVRDAQTGQMLATHSIAAGNVAPPFVGAVGVLGVDLLGLQNFRERYTQHETIYTVRDLKPTALPDRWYGLSVFDMLVWTPRAGDPLAPDAANSLRSIREWVQRGGHLVIIMSSVADPWGDPQLSDLVPPVRMTQVSDLQAPDWLLPSAMRPVDREAVKSVALSGYVLEPDMTRPGAHVLLSDDAQRPLVVARQVGFGRVTLIGIDLTDPRLTRLGCPMPESTFWRSVVGWQSPGFSGSDIKKMENNTETIKGPSLLSPAMREAQELARGMIDEELGMRGNAFGALMLAMLVFCLYWVVAGPISFVVLKTKKRTHLSWSAFVVVVIIFSVVAWGGALLIRPQRTGVQHFTVLTGDAALGVVHTHSWFSLMVPYHGRADVAVQNDESIASQNTLASAGVLPGSDTGGFLDEQRYTIEAAAPTEMSAPMRATSKQFEVDYLGKPIVDPKGAQRDWSMPKGAVKLVDGFPAGELTHNLPGTLLDVRLVFCAGGGQPPVFWRPAKTDQWPAGAAMDVAPPSAAARTPLVVPRPPALPGQVPYFVRDPQDKTKFVSRQWVTEGFLGKIQGVSLDPGSINAAMALTFYDLLPPPEFVNSGRARDTYGYNTGSPEFRRSAARPFNLSALTAMPNLIIIGRVETDAAARASMPTPVTIDGDPVRSAGQTLVRWIYPLEDAMKQSQKPGQPEDQK